ncbi:MAG: glycosyltransferase family 2 protein [Vicinamibacterales bacterium]
MSRPRVSVITPVFNEEAGLPDYERAVRSVLLDNDEFAFDVLLVDDGSRDGSWAAIEAMCARDPRFYGLRLSRNYGAHVALSAGFAHARGDAVATLASDLQDPPETVLEFARRWRAGAQIVWGHRKTREDSAWRVTTSRLFERLIRRFAMPRESKFTVGSFLLVDHRVAECFRQFQEHNRVTFALVAWTGFKQEIVEYHRRERRVGTSGWTYRRMVKTMYDTFIGFSFLPIRLMTLAGVLLSLLTLPFAVYLVVVYLTGRPLPGWTSVMLALTLFFGIQFLLMGVVGEYLYRIYAEVVRRPLYFVSDTTADEQHVERAG